MTSNTKVRHEPFDSHGAKGFLLPIIADPWPLLTSNCNAGKQNTFTQPLPIQLLRADISGELPLSHVPAYALLIANMLGYDLRPHQHSDAYKILQKYNKNENYSRCFTISLHRFCPSVTGRQ